MVDKQANCYCHFQFYMNSCLCHFSLSASVSYGNHGCQGGNMYNTYLYIIANEGVETAKLYPFQGKVGRNRQTTECWLHYMP